MFDRITHKILKKIRKEREIPLSKIAAELPKLFGDHRDFYPLATLIKAGYISVPHIDTKTGEGMESAREQMLAIRLYAMSLGEKSVSYMGISFHYSGGTMENERFYCTATTDLYFHEQRVKRTDWFVTTVVAVFVAVLSGWLGAYFK